MRDSCSSRESHKSSRSSQEEQPPSQVSLVIRDGQGRVFFHGAYKAGRAMVSSGIGILLRQNMVAGQTFSSCFKLQK